MKKIDIIIQARLGSTRLPKKVLADINGKCILEFLVQRIRKSNLINKFILATTDNYIDDILADKAKQLDLIVVRGSENDVLSRFYKATKISDAKYFIRVTADCPFLDHLLIDDLIKEFNSNKYDYLSNCFPPCLPDGFDLEIFTREALIIANKKCTNKSFREHVTPWLRESGNFKVGFLSYKENFKNLRLTIDEYEDLLLARELVLNFNVDVDTSWNEIIKILKKNPRLLNINSKFKRNEGNIMNKSQKMWRRAKRVIPGGNMLLSKRPEMFLPTKWPTYFSKAKGCQVWDLDNQKYNDLALMGVGTNILGYCNREVDEAVKKTVENGNLSSFNCPEEVLLAEKLIELHPWADMVKLARTGGEANAISIRIARAASSRDTVAICGYHGWHDWYLATNIINPNGLEEHLLAGLEPKGVPQCLKGSVQPFSFNNIEQLKNIVSKHKLAAIKMEVERTSPPKKGFLEAIRKICDEENIILIFDECTSGFRETYGGIHKKYRVEPDIAIFGKALGNGYAITAIIGRRSIMEAAQTSFISSTFWTERIGPTAALKTLEIMERERSWEQITQKGIEIRDIWQEIANQNKLEINIYGIKALSGFSFKGDLNREYKTLITQEMLKKGFLASTNCYLSTAHKSKLFSDYSNVLNEVFELISQCENGYDINELLENPICHNRFERLN